MSAADGTGVRGEGPAAAPSEADGTGERSRPRRTLRQRWSLGWRRNAGGRLVLIGVVALIAGGFLGRATSPDEEHAAAQEVAAEVLPVALDADGIWTSGAEGRAPISEGLVALRGEHDPSVIEGNLDAWLAAYDTALIRLAAADVPPAARPVQRQLITAVTLSRDAAEVLGFAATIEDEAHRRDLTTEVGRLRTRSEQLTASARAAINDLEGSRTDVGPLPELRGFLDSR